MTHLDIYSSKAQDASGPHRPDLYIPGLNMGWFLPAHRPHSAKNVGAGSLEARTIQQAEFVKKLEVLESLERNKAFETHTLPKRHGYNMCDGHGGDVKRTMLLAQRQERTAPGHAAPEESTGVVGS